jgi:hypothetical protein
MLFGVVIFFVLYTIVLLAFTNYKKNKASARTCLKMYNREKK